MADTELLQELLQEMKAMREDLNGVKHEVKEVSRQLARSTASLEKMDGLILDEVERVHEIMLQRTDDLKKKIG